MKLYFQVTFLSALPSSLFKFPTYVFVCVVKNKLSNAVHQVFSNCSQKEESYQCADSVNSD